VGASNILAPTSKARKYVIENRSKDFLPFYAILRSIPDKLGGVIAMIAAILILLVLPFFHVSLIRSSTFRPLWKFLFWLFVANFLLLGWIGGNPVEYPYVMIGQILTITYFSYFIILVPLFAFLDNVFTFLEVKA